MEGCKLSKGVIPVAGFGTRLLPATKAQPKEMLPLVDKPAIQYVVEEATSSGIESLLLITGRGKRAIEDYFDYSIELEEELESQDKKELLHLVRQIGNMAQIFYVRQKLQRGLGDAIYCSREFVNGSPFAVLLADDIIEDEGPELKQMINLFERTDEMMLAVHPVPPESVSQWGVIKGEKIGEGLFQVTDLVEKPAPEEAPSNLAIVGRYILKPTIFPVLANTPPGKGGEIQLTDALRTLVKEERILAWQIRGNYFGVGDKLGYLKANIALALKRKELSSQLRDFLQEILSTTEEKRNHEEGD
ncbi:MAG: UTP--glucose-phosphate uridylyltransferase [Candidatus Atribacteria bacterium]|nr:UTP--glucose-phosphate uridylyltransferase [Candidatus Atribacteria bacterium]